MLLLLSDSPAFAADLEMGESVTADSEFIDKLAILNQIGENLNRAVDVRGVLEHALTDLVKLMGLQTGWIVLRDPAPSESPTDGRYTLVAHHNLPPALDASNRKAWEGSCTCQQLCNESRLTEAYNEVRCSRLARAGGDRRGLAVHASAPLRSGDEVLGILNVAGADWSSFSPQALALLTNAGNQIGIALERARLYDLLQEQRMRERAALLSFSKQLLSRMGLDELMDYLVEQVRIMLRVDASALLLPNKESGVLQFRATSGWHADPVAEGRRVPADESSGCGLVMHSQQPLQMEDSTAYDPAPWAPAWLQTEGFRAHALVPLLVEGRSIGVLVINQRQPHLLDEDDMRGLKLMANQAAVAIEKARLHEEEIRMQALEKELAVARQIQLSLLPEVPPTVAGWEFAAVYEAAREVGGDFFDFLELPSGPGELGLVVGDVTDKGVPAALFMARTSTMIRTAAQHGFGPSETLRQTNELIIKDGRPALLLTALYAVLDTRRGRLVYANAGHPPPLWLQASTGTLHVLDGHGLLLGAFAGIELEEQAVDVAPGDLLVFYTDGITEAMDASRQPFGEERLRAAVAARARGSAQQVLDGVVATVKAFTGEMPQSDDIALLVIKRSSAPGGHSSFSKLAGAL